MNREIIFRGKSKEELTLGEWIYGYLFNIEGEKAWIWNGIPQEVLTDTVGQYTGLKDRNGKEIYEGDILLLSDKNTYQELVVVEQGPYGWVFYNPKTVLRFKDGSYTYRAVENYRRLFGIGEVVGNIHDNPELLEGDRTAGLQYAHLSADRPVILVDDLMHPGFRMRTLDPILRQEDVTIRMVLVGILSGHGRDLMDAQGRPVDAVKDVN